MCVGIHQLLSYCIFNGYIIMEVNDCYFLIQSFVHNSMYTDDLAANIDTVNLYCLSSIGKSICSIISKFDGSHKKCSWKMVITRWHTTCVVGYYIF